MKLTGEAKLLAGLAALVLAGVAFLVLTSRGGAGGDVRPSPTPTPQLTSAFVDELVKASRHVKGAANAPMTIVEFADLQCPSCRRAYNAHVKDIEKKLPVRFAFMHMPLPMHENALPAAAATEAAANQGKFWEMYALLFDGEETPVGESEIMAAATKLKLDPKRFGADRASTEVNQRIEADKSMGQRYNLDTTPTFVIRDKNGKVMTVSGAGDFDKVYEDLKDGVLDQPAPTPGPPMPAMPTMPGPAGAGPGAAPPGPAPAGPVRAPATAP